MQHTLVAVFDNRNDAQNAMNELLASSFTRNEVRLSNADPTGMTDSVTGSSEPYTNDGTGEGIGASIKHFFTDLFGADHSERASRYEGAVTRGHHVLTVTADSLPEVERAADIVERYGPTDIDEQASGPGSHSAGAMGLAGSQESMRMSGAGGMQSARPVAQSGQPGVGQSQQLDNPGDPQLFAQQSLHQAEPMGQTYQEPQGSSGLGATGATSFQGSTLQDNSVQGSALEGSAKQGSLSGSQQRDTRMGDSVGGDMGGGMRSTEIQRGRSRIYSPSAGAGLSPGLDSSSAAGDDDSHYRSHYESNLSSSGDDYDSYKPAYSFGKEMRKSELYRNQPWDDIEGDMRRGWDSRIAVGTGSGSASGSEGIGATWDKMKAAIRHGWESMTGEHSAVSTSTPYSTSVRSAGSDDDDSAYRSHWNANYSAASEGASYDQYRPAYSYGADMARSEKYRGRQWNEVEGELRSDWDARHGGNEQSTWDKMKLAVRHGWDRMTS
ncbi:hypothetical protein [Massilia sp. H6]|uniref:hypothetical protein n=1 Tax=Massilia sp. H6 TaxID=2970464 RepID=UPI0021688CE5|nr:hypothetical protein [Massilia sp. H6]UVW27141.1 hypothetical protein NRS07_11240 [Massilia sp. H6]